MPDQTPNTRQADADNTRLRAERDQARRWAVELENQLAAVRAFAEDMRTWCSPHGVATDYADRLLALLDDTKEDQS